MRLTGDETVMAYHCVAAVMRGFQTAPPPWAVQQLFDRLNTAFRMSQSGHERCCGREESESDKLMSSRQVAAKLGYTKRHINRIAERLGGVDVDGYTVFRESAVLEHLEGRDGHPRPGYRAAAS